MNRFSTPLGEIEIKIFGHASLLIKWNGKNIFVDPYSEVANYSLEPEAHLVLLTHHHFDHLDQEALKHIVNEQTVFVATKTCKEQLPQANAIAQGESFNYEGIEIIAVYAYNIQNKNDQGEPFHPRGVGNGYILNFKGYRLYIAGDTELIPEMKELGEIDLAFMPKNLPYTMSDQMFVEAVKTVMPKQLFAIHYFEIDVPKLKAMMPKGVALLNEN